jgi:hypothetical protein
MRTSAPAALLTMMIASAGCGPADDPSGGPAATYVGTVNGSDAVVGIVSKGNGKVIGYSCGGPVTLEDLTTWVSGPGDGDSFELVRGAGTIAGTFAGDVVNGSLDINGADHTFIATRVEPGTPFGLFGAGLDDPDCLTGVVVLPGSGTPWMQGASTCGAVAGPFNQVTPGAAPTTPEGFHVTVEGWASAPILVTPVEVAPRY